MSIITVILVLVIAGFVMWMINAYVPMEPPFKTALNVLIVIILILWILQVLGIFTGMGHIHP